MMRHLILFAVTVAALAAADPFHGIRFEDGVARTRTPGQPVFVYYFSGQCPNARGSLGKGITELYETIEREHLAGRLLLITPDLEPAELKAQRAELIPRIADPWWAFDPTNCEKISLNNIYQSYVILGDGKVVQGDRELALKVMRASTAYRIPKPAGDDAKLIEGWWAVERQRPGALKAAVAAAKKQPSWQPLVDAVTTAFNERSAKLVAGSDLAAVEGLEQLLSESEGALPLKDAQARLKTLQADPALKDELKARGAYQKCQQLLNSGKTKDAENGKAGLAQLAKAMPGTVYGRKAAESAGSK